MHVSATARPQRQTSLCDVCGSAVVRLVVAVAHRHAAARFLDPAAGDQDHQPVAGAAGLRAGGAIVLAASRDRARAAAVAAVARRHLLDRSRCSPSSCRSARRSTRRGGWWRRGNIYALFYRPGAGLRRRCACRRAYATIVTLGLAALAAIGIAAIDRRHRGARRRRCRRADAASRRSRCRFRSTRTPREYKQTRAGAAAGVGRARSGGAGGLSLRRAAAGVGGADRAAAWRAGVRRALHVLLDAPLEAAGQRLQRRRAASVRAC